MIRFTTSLLVSVALFLAMGVLPVKAVAQCDGTVTHTIGGHEVTCEGFLYDYPGAGESTWFYTVTSNPGPGANPPALSHIEFGLFSCIDLPGPPDEKAGTWSGDLPDPVLSRGDGDPDLVDGGIKFEEEFDGDVPESRQYYFTAFGNPPEGLVSAIMKAGPGETSGDIWGPDHGEGFVWGTVFWDNGDGGGTPDDGMRNGDEPGLTDALVGLFTGPDAGLTDLTGPLGWYYHWDVTPGLYDVDVNEATLLGHSPPLKGRGVDGNLAKPADLGCVRLDFPYLALEGSAIGDFVWYEAADDDQFGVQEADEPGIAGIGLEIVGGPSGVGRTGTTDKWGWYLFDDLLPCVAPCEYTVEVDVFTADSDNIATTRPGAITKSTIFYKTMEPCDLFAVGPTTVGGSVPANAMNQAFDFAFSESNLPVELTSFTARSVEGVILIEWTTASESDNAGFAIERAVGETFEEIGWVPGAGSTNNGQAYSFRVDNLEPGLYGFRLRQVDFDGTLTFSRMVEAAVEIPGAFYLGAVYPNPFNPSAVVSIAVRHGQHVTATLHDALGRIVRTLYVGEMAANTTERVRIDASNFSSGVYIVHVRGEEFAATTTATLMR